MSVIRFVPLPQMSLATIIIDDQPDAVEDLQYLIEKNELPLQVVATAHSGAEGLAAILKHKPQLVFLDVVMPGMSGFEMLDLLPGLDFHLIITTSVDQYAIQAIRSSALDFLLKPVKQSELKDAVARAVEKTTQPTRPQLHLLQDHLRERSRPIRKIALNISDGVELVSLEDILFFESDGNYTTVHFRDSKSMLVTKQLGKFEETVEPAGFFRIHNSYLVNLNHVKKFVRSDGGYVILENGKSISVSRNRKDAFLEMLGRM
jgi:two-component system LytT family response regulator